MAVEKIEEYGNTLKVILKPTKKFPVGYFYCDSEDEDLVKAYTWYLYQFKNNMYIFSKIYSINKICLFHRELAYKYLSYYPDYLDHINRVEFDNTDNNLNIVNQQQNMFNQPTRGYSISNDGNYFQSLLRYNYNELNFGAVKTEVEACILQYQLETDYLRNLMQDAYYMYDFLKDRRQDLDILDLERTKKISPEEATYKHVIRHTNAWHYYRYNLAEYFKDNNIPIPKYGVDEQGFMVHPITGQKLCPFN